MTTRKRLTSGSAQPSIRVLISGMRDVPGCPVFRRTLYVWSHFTEQIGNNEWQTKLDLLNRPEDIEDDIPFLFNNLKLDGK